jgi:hypothetical protein
MNLAIDFARSARWSPLAAVLATAAIACAALTGWLWWQGEQRIAALTDAAAVLQLQQQRAAAVQRPAGVITPQRARSVNDAIRRLNLPWDRLFVALNAAGSGVKTGSVALLALEPDVDAGLVRLTAEARDSDAMLRYQRRLEAQPGIASALLSRHEVVLEDPQAPLRFWLEVKLVADGGGPR